MTIWRLLIACALAGITVLSVVYSWNSFRSRGRKLLASVLRIVSGTAIIIAFLEPVITVQRLPHGNREIPVLIDASESMSLFGADSVVRAFRSAVAPFSDPSKRTIRRPVFILFGDSIRPFDSAVPFTAADRASFFPQNGELPSVRSATEVIIISDANWSNQTPVTAVPGASAVWYLPLHRVRTAATIACELPDSIVTPADTPSVLEVPCSGGARTAASIAVYIDDGNTPLAADTLTVPPGPFHHTFTLRLPPVSAGAHCYTVSAVNLTDTVRTTRFMLRHAVPHTFSYTIPPSVPSLDRRFLRSALAGNDEFTDASQAKGRSADCRFIFDTPSSVAPSSRRTLDVHLGKLPGTPDAASTTVTNDNIAVTGSPRNPFARLPAAGLPPATAIPAGKEIAVTTAWITASTGRDTLPLVFKGIYRNRPMVGCAVSSFWKWDFLPLGHAATGEADVFAFSRCLLDAVAATIRELQTDTLLVYPVRRPAAGRPLRITAVIPSVNAPELQTVTIALNLRTEDGATIRDTVLQLIATGGMLHEAVLPPLAPGGYTLSGSLTAGAHRYASAVSFTVEPDDAERAVTGQNELLLREMGQPFSPADTAFLSRLFTGDRRFHEQEPVPEKIRLRRSWWLFALLLLTLGSEWLLRRASRLD